MPKERKEDAEPFWRYVIIVGTIAFVLVVGLFYWLGIYHVGGFFNPSQETENGYSEIGQYGDSFGYVNALFSGLAFAGVIVALFMQTRELAYQRREITNARKAQQRSAYAQKKAAKAQEESVRLMNEELEHARDVSRTKVLIDFILKLEEERELRSLVMKIPDSSLQTPDTWAENQRDAANVVAGTFNIAGLLVRFNKVDRSIALPEWKRIVPECFDRLNFYISRERRDRRNPDLWSHFDWLNEEIARQLEASSPTKT